MESKIKASVLPLISICLVIFLVILNSCVEASREFKVGDELGWVKPPPNDVAMYSEWAARNRFQVGDSLLFTYNNDSVLVVDKWDYYHCNTSGPIKVLKNGNTTLKLDWPGLFYFISGYIDHCNNGQRLAVNVMSQHDHPVNPPPNKMAPSPSPSSEAKANSVSQAVIGSVSLAVLATIADLLHSQT